MRCNCVNDENICAYAVKSSDSVGQFVCVCLPPTAVAVNSPQGISVASLRPQVNGKTASCQFYLGVKQ